MLKPGEGVLCALSGGPDSVAMTIALAGLRDRFKNKLAACYVDHGLRPDDVPAEITFCRELCKKFEIEFVTRSIEVKDYARQQGLSMQEAARLLRYDALNDAAHECGAGRIATAHNADDQAETLILRLLRGSGPTGLGGIPPVRDHIIRPLIETPRAEIERFLKTQHIVAMQDSSNKKTDYLRNRVRKELMPIVLSINPGFLDTASHTQGIFRQEEQHWQVAVTKTMMRLITRKTDAAIELFLSPLESMDAVLLRRVLRRCLDETRGLRGVGYVHIESIVHLIKHSGPGHRVQIPGGVRAIKKYSTLLITSAPPMRITERTVDAPCEVAIEEALALLRFTVSDEKPASPGDGRATIALDADKVQFPLTIRPRRAGDYLYPIGLGHKKKLQDLFVDAKLPREERDAVPVVASGADVLWVVGHRADGRFAQSDTTRRWLICQCLPLRRSFNV